MLKYIVLQEKRFEPYYRAIMSKDRIALSGMDGMTWAEMYLPAIMSAGFWPIINQDRAA
jgi:hypothetical protein